MRMAKNWRASSMTTKTRRAARRRPPTRRLTIDGSRHGAQATIASSGETLTLRSAWREVNQLWHNSCVHTLQDA